jgi:hypothetical protein
VHFIPRRANGRPGCVTSPSACGSPRCS